MVRLNDGQGGKKGRKAAVTRARCRPPRSDLRPGAIPAELLAEPRWVCWRWEWREAMDGIGDWTKAPLVPATGTHASTAEPRTWGTFDAALAAYRAGHGDGVGFVLGGGWFGIDVDDCVDAHPDTADVSLSDLARQLLAEFPTYAEYSPTGTGVKLFARGDLSAVLNGKTGRKDPAAGLEVYTSARFFTVTGHVVDAGHAAVRECQAAGERLVRERFPADDPETPPAPPPPPLDLSDRDLLRRMFAAKNGAKAKRLYAGDWAGYPSRSEADLALVDYLAFYFRTPDRIDAVYRGSGLMRAKWDRADYRERTIRRALAGRERYHDAGRGGRITLGNGKLHTDRRRGDADGPPGERGTPPAEGRPAPQIFTDTDVANGRRFARDHGHNVRYVADWNRWLVFDGCRWAVDAGETLVERLAKETTDRMAVEAAEKLADAAREVATAENEEQEEKHNKALAAARRELAWAKKSQDMRLVRRMLAAARSEPAVRVACGRDVFDTHHHLFNCPNGTVDLRTGELRGHRREDFLTKLCPTRYNPAAPRDEYLAFLGRVFHGRPGVAAYVRRFSGYAVTGETCDHLLHVFEGLGSNGKGVLLTTWTGVLGEGEYAHTAVPELLVNDGRDRHPTERVQLRGSRLVVCSETDEDGRLDEARVKALTGGDTINARGMRQDFFQFRPTHKLVLATNHRPRVKGTDHGVWRRVRLVPFGVRFWTEADQLADPQGDFPAEFRAEPGLEGRLLSFAESVLADMVAHAVEFYRAGSRLVPPPEVVAATREYRSAEDLIGRFLDGLVRPDPGGRVPAGTLYARFRAWCEAEGHPEADVPGVRSFGGVARARFPHKKASSVVYHVRVVPAEG